MDNSLNNANEYTSLLKDIEERQAIVDKFNATGNLDRNDAIKKIVELRKKDAKVRTIYETTVLPNRISLENCSNAVIIEHLKLQIATLSAELIEKTGEII